MSRINLAFVILICILLLPFIANAKECNQNNIKVESIILEDTRGNIEEVSAPNSDDGKIHLDLKMNVVGDFAEYKIILKNTSDEEYYFDEKSLNLDTNYVDYEVQYEDGSTLIKSGEDKIITLKVVYKNKVASSNLVNGLYSDNQVFKVYLSDKSVIDDLINNPITSRKYIFIIIIGLIIGFILINKKYRKSSYLLLVFLIIPFTVKALCRHTLEIETNLVIDGKEAIFLPGKEVNVKMKHLAGDDTSSVTDEYTFRNETITSIKHSESAPPESNKKENNIVSISDSPYPIYMWYENNTIYWWSEDIHPSLNEDAAFMFIYLLELTDISGLEMFDSSSTNSFFGLFLECNLNNLDYIKKWNTSNVTNMKSIFTDNEYLTDMTGVKDWDVSKVRNMGYIFRNCYSLEEVDLSNWDTSSAIYMDNMFGMWQSNNHQFLDGKLKRIILSSKFNTSNVTNMYAMFANNTQLEDYEFLKYLDTSNATDTRQMFVFNKKLDTTEYFLNWDVSNVKSFYQMFSYCERLQNLKGLENWNVSNVTSFNNMFDGASNLSSTASIDNWNISPNATFTYMFRGVPIHPEFTKVPGTWNSSGTFTPTS